MCVMQTDICYSARQFTLGEAFLLSLVLPRLPGTAVPVGHLAAAATCAGLPVWDIAAERATVQRKGEIETAVQK